MAKMIQVRNVSDRLHDELVRRATARNLTLTAYVEEILEREVARPPREEVFERIARRDPIVLDRSATTGSVNVVYKTPGPVYSMPIGGGAVAAEVTIRVDGRDTLFSVPEGVYDGSAGWKANDAARALFLNKEAPAGPTAARKMMVRAPGGVSMVAKGLGDTAALDVIAPPAGTVDVQYAVTSGGVTGRTCTRFAAGACAHKKTSTATRTSS